MKVILALLLGLFSVTVHAAVSKPALTRAEQDALAASKKAKIKAKAKKPEVKKPEAKKPDTDCRMHRWHLRNKCHEANK
jgi:hypothetical protein